jgi:hypothetical protein
MRWPDACEPIERIKAERPELLVDHAAVEVFLRPGLHGAVVFRHLG